MPSHLSGGAQQFVEVFGGVAAPHQADLHRVGRLDRDGEGHRLGQFAAGMWEFTKGNTFGATAFTSYGAFWLSFWAFEQFYAKDITDKVTLGNAVGLFLIAWGIFTAYMFIASLRVSVAVAVVFFLLAVTFIVLGIGTSFQRWRFSASIQLGYPMKSSSAPSPSWQTTTP